MKAASRPDPTRRALGLLFPLAGALRANRVRRARRPEMDFVQPTFRDNEIAHWQASLEASPSLGAVIDQVYEETTARGAEAPAPSAHGSLRWATRRPMAAVERWDRG